MEVPLRWFYWTAGVEIPAHADLRNCGWRMREWPGMVDGDIAPHIFEHPILLDYKHLDGAFWNWLDGRKGQGLRRWVLVFGVEDGEERARLLRKGFGEALPSNMSLGEFQARARRVMDHAGSLLRWRGLGVLKLDLMRRDAFVEERPMGLHPREFDVLWRLLENPGAAVDKVDLLRDVWRLSFVPETNSVAVHASRLRSKMAAAGLSGWIRTTPGGGYVIAVPD
jgi:two-component system OmpR family response regulator